MGEAAKLDAATAVINTSGCVCIPALANGVQRTVFFQWRTVSVPQAPDNNLLVVDANWPVPFPTTTLSIIHALNNSLIYSTIGNPFSSSSIVDRSVFRVASAYNKSQSTVTAWGVGY